MTNLFGFGKPTIRCPNCGWKYKFEGKDSFAYKYGDKQDYSPERLLAEPIESRLHYMMSAWSLERDSLGGLNARTAKKTKGGYECVKCECTFKEGDIEVGVETQ